MSTAAKVWLGLLALVAAAAAALLLVAPAAIGRDVERELGGRLERAQHAASLLLKVNARMWMDTAAHVATDPPLVEALEQATRGPSDLGLVHKTVKDRLRYFNDKMRVDMVVATDAKGRVIARAGADESVYRDGLEGFPLVADALRGYRGDDTWSLDGKLYRVAAAPVIAKDHYVGALLLGQEVSADLARSMQQKLESEVAFLLRGRVLASSTDSPLLARLPGLVDELGDELGRAVKAKARRIELGDRAFLVVVAPFSGQAAGHKAALVLHGELPPPSPLRALGRALGQVEKQQLPWLSIGVAVAVAAAAFLIGLVLVRAGSDGPMERLARDAQALARGERNRLDDANHPGKLGTVARAINTTLDRLGSATRQSGALTAAENPFRAAAPAVDLEPSPPPSPPPRVPRPTPTVNARRPEPTPPPPVRPADSEPNTLDREPFPPPSAEKSAHGPDPVSLVAPLPPMPSAEVQTTVRPPPQAPPSPYPPEEDEPTRANLKAVPRPGKPPEPAAAPPPPPSPEAALESELSAVYHEFIETKQRLGEPTEGVTLDKFIGKLKANRAQLIERYACKTVRFQVYVKDGKAALKATPVQA